MYVLDEDPATPFAHAYVTVPLTYEGEVRLQAADTAIGGQGDQGALFISTSCIQAGRAICFMQYLKSQQGAKLTHWGVEGLHYTVQEDGTLAYEAQYRNPKNYTSDQASISLPIQEKTGIELWNYGSAV